MYATHAQQDEQTGVREAIRATRESLLHLSLHPHCSRTLSRAVTAVEHLGDQATWHDQTPVTRLAERMASTLRSAALGRFGVAASDLAAVHRLLSDAIAHDTIRA
jgi:hypothetical protein